MNPELVLSDMEPIQFLFKEVIFFMVFEKTNS